MITSQLIGQVTESLIPYIMFRSRITKVSKEGKKIVMKTADLSDDIERQGTQEQYLVRFIEHYRSMDVKHGNWSFRHQKVSP